MNTTPRLNIHLRIQHGVLILTAAASLVSGFAVGLGASGGGFGFDRLYHFHIYAGFAAALILLYHAVYLFVRGYVEGKNWPTFPMAWKTSDWKGLAAQMRYSFGGAIPPPAADHFRYSQKALYWGTALLLALLTLTGFLVGFWDSVSTIHPLSFISLSSTCHRGLSLLLVAAFLCHLYEVLTWKGRLFVQWSWLNGRISEDYAKEELPGFFSAYLQQEKEWASSMSKQSADEREDEERRDERAAVEFDLEEGNRLAGAEKYVDALFHYRRALEKYPGYSQARFNMAVVLTRMGEKAMAKEHFETFLREDPFHPLARKAQEHISSLESEEP